MSSIQRRVCQVRPFLKYFQDSSFAFDPKGSPHCLSAMFLPRSRHRRSLFCMKISKGTAANTVRSTWSGTGTRSFRSSKRGSNRRTNAACNAVSPASRANIRAPYQVHVSGYVIYFAGSVRPETARGLFTKRAATRLPISSGELPGGHGPKSVTDALDTSQSSFERTGDPSTNLKGFGSSLISGNSATGLRIFWPMPGAAHTKTLTARSAAT